MHDLHQISKRITECEQQYDRKPNSVQLLAVSKKQSCEHITQALAAGQRRFGENYLQEALTKIDTLKNADCEWHFIGPIQSNKTRAIAEHFDWVQSVDNLKIAERLSQQRPTALAPLNICIQVNIDNEPQKSGVTLESLPDLAQAITTLPRLHLRGLMAIPAAQKTFAQQYARFKQLADVYTDLQQHFKLDTLSMGMSNDYPAAIAAGSTMIRIGTALFGERKQ